MSVRLDLHARVDRRARSIHPSDMDLAVVASLERGKNANDADPHVARAIDAMRADPSRAWTVRELARRAGLSRAAFARRFKRETGGSPLRWLTEHRLALAAERLRASGLTLAGVASLVGYRCEFAFAKAFKRVYGVPPGIYRRAGSTLPRFRAAA